MKIGIVTEYYYPLIGGITEHVHHFAIEAKKMGHEPVIVTSLSGDRSTRTAEGIRIVRIGRSLPLFSNGSIARVTVGFGMGRRLRKVFLKEKFDIIHIHSPFVPSLPLFAQRYANAPVVGTFHTQFDSSLFLEVCHRAMRKYYDHLSGKIAVSHLCVDSMRPFFEKFSNDFDADFDVIPNGVDIDKFDPSNKKIEKFMDGKKNIFFLSRIEPRNGLEYLIKAFQMIREKRDDCRLIIGGSGPLKKHCERMVPNALKNDIHFLGQINGSRPEYYSTADIFCFPTTKASFGITLLEAMASAKPVVAFSLEAFERIITNGKDGILCGEPSAENLAREINRLLDDQKLRENIGTNARVTSEKYSWKKIAEKVIDHYEEILSA